jgi:hypothetical protein
MSHHWCPPSRRGHTWREANVEDVSVLSAGIDPRAARICKRCGRLGCVSNQGVIRPVEIL